jgi:hypothetical protein
MRQVCLPRERYRRILAATGTDWQMVSHLLRWQVDATELAKNGPSRTIKKQIRKLKP